MSAANNSTEEGMSAARRAYARLHGLERALALFPDTLAAAQQRGGRPMGPLPDHVPATTEPALWFVPMRGGFDP